MENPLLIFFCFEWAYKASLDSYAHSKQKKLKVDFHQKLRVPVPTSEREGKLSNPRARAARARCMGEKLRKFTETLLDRQHYKQAEIRTLTLRTFFRFVCGAGWGVKKTTCACL
jgi:hypothetical protein